VLLLQSSPGSSVYPVVVDEDGTSETLLDARWPNCTLPGVLQAAQQPYMLHEFKKHLAGEPPARGTGSVRRYQVNSSCHCTSRPLNTACQAKRVQRIHPSLHGSVLPVKAIRRVAYVVSYPADTWNCCFCMCRQQVQRR
jgi:hypothetical protein